MLKKILAVVMILGIGALAGCSPGKKSADDQPKVTVIPVSQADKDRILAFRKDLTNLEDLTDRALKLATDEVLKVVKGGEATTDLAGIVEKAKADCLRTGEALDRKPVPDNLPPEIAGPLTEGKNGLVASYKSRGESYEAIRIFLAESNPLALLDYKKKSSLAGELSRNALEKLDRGLATAGIPSS